MNNDLREDLKAYIDGELEPGRAEQIRVALETDETLRKEEEFMRSLGRSFASLRPTSEASPQSAEKSAASFIRKRRSILGSPWVWAGACSILLIVVLARPLIQSAQSELSGSDSPSPFPAASSSGNASPPAPEAPAVGGATDMHESEPGRITPQPEESSISAAPPGPAGFTRALIRTGSLTLRVESVDATRDEITQRVSAWGGYVEGQTKRDSQARVAEGEMILRVPSERFDEAMAELESQGETINSNTTSDDVSDQIVDLDARLKTMRAQEEIYRKLLGEAKTVGQVMQVQDRLSSLRAEIESIDARAQSLKNLAALSTIRVHLIQRPSASEAASTSGWAGDAWANAVKGVAGALQTIATAVIFVLVWLPIWLPLTLLLIVVYRRALSPRT